MTATPTQTTTEKPKRTRREQPIVIFREVRTPDTLTFTKVPIPPDAKPDDLADAMELIKQMADAGALGPGDFIIARVIHRTTLKLEVPTKKQITLT